MNLSTLYRKLTDGKYIVGLLIGFIGSISFCSAGNYTVFSQTFTETCSDCTVSTTDVNSDLVCIVNDTCGYYDFLYNFDHGSRAGNTTATDGHLFGGLGICSSDVIYYSTVGCNYTVNYITVDIEDILSGNVDTNYCIENNLCPVTEDCTGGLSDLFINNIQYPGAPTIKFTIPEEIQRDQNTDEEEVNIDVIGYGYDQDKMQQMVNTQYYKPTAEEMSGLMEKVADFLPLVAIALLITRIRRVIKKVF